MGARAGTEASAWVLVRGWGWDLGTAPQVWGGPLCTRRVVFYSFPRGPRCSPALGVGAGDTAAGALGCLLIHWDSVSLIVSL